MAKKDREEGKRKQKKKKKKKGDGRTSITKGEGRMFFKNVT